MDAGPAVRSERKGPVALIVVDHPPVNALALAVRTGLLRELRAAIDDPAVGAIVLRCEGRTFIAGADVNEFGAPPAPPHLPEVTQAFEGAAKPVVAALHGTALGGGFEIALACHWRIALADAQVGLPEVRLGLMPGAGGTQRLPRLVGVANALRWIVEGKPVGARDAMAQGAIDEVVDDGLDAAAMAAAQRLAGSAPRRTGALAVPPFDPAVFHLCEAGLAHRTPKLVAPRRCVEALRIASTAPLDEGLRREREMFLELRGSPQAAALRHAFLGEREVGKVPGMPRDVAPRPIGRVGVVGAGTMGQGIAMCFANAGYPVVVLDADAGALERAQDAIRKVYASSSSRGSLSEAEARVRTARIVPTASWDSLADCDLIVEAVFEDIGVKRGVFGRLDAIARPGAILATNTSYLGVGEIAGFTSRPQDVVGMHFFSPANVMRLLENVRARDTADDVVATVMQLGRRLGKVAVLSGDAYGFIGNRMLAERSREAHFLLEEGALPQQIDRALQEFGFPMGPFAVGDLSGLDISWRNRQARAHLRKPGVRDCNLLDKVCDAGRLGQKTGAGWYRYESGSRMPLPDPQIEALILAHSAEAGIVRRHIDDREIVERCVYSLINEAARILEDGVARRPVDIDMVWLHGYGFPAWRGGPLFHADQVGLGEVHDAILRYREQHGPSYWTPAASLVERVREGRGFYAANVASPSNVC